MSAPYKYWSSFVLNKSTLNKIHSKNTRISKLLHRSFPSYIYIYISMYTYIRFLISRSPVVWTFWILSNIFYNLPTLIASCCFPCQVELNMSSIITSLAPLLPLPIRSVQILPLLYTLNTKMRIGRLSMWWQWQKWNEKVN